MLTITQIKRELKGCSKDEVMELLIETVKGNKDAQAYVSVQLQGEAALNELMESYKEQIRKEFYPIRGFPKQRPAIVKQALAEMRSMGKGTIWPFELLVFFCEVAVQSIHEEGDVFENMGDLFTDSYEAVIQTLNKEKTPDLYEKYKDRVKAILHTTGCECWGIHDSLEGSYSELRWVEHEEADEDDDPDALSLEAWSKWLRIPEEIRQKCTSHIWCVKCAATTTIKDLSVQLDMYGLMIKGGCFHCGHQVTRFIEK